MYFWPGVVAIWGALIAGLASVYFYFRVERGRSDLLVLARNTYSAFARLDRRRRCGPRDAHPPASGLTSLTSALFEQRPADPLSDLDVLGGSGRVISPVVLPGDR
jgi:hypothetical protein